jgi:serine/threonine protein kinase/TolB-like protein/Flp pilus assembly protein TadD
VRLTRNEFALLSTLLDTGLELTGQEREIWLENLAEPFPGARQILRRMLENYASGERSDFLQSLPILGTEPGRSPEQYLGADAMAGSLIGAYRLIREIGQGGMSSVWLARRTDELTERSVALKLPHLYLGTAQLAERFTQEKNILAKLAHPNIAHLYDAGVSSQGQPYLVMEYVEGEALATHCDLNGLTIPARLALFLQILDAVNHAHALGVIHRDIKPSNILVRPPAHVVLLDFGIAKLLVEGQARESDLTQSGGALLTLHYASPEHLAGGALTVQSDVYSLGVVLYELLCGRRPHDPVNNTIVSRGAIEAAILTTDPDRPSAVIMVGREVPAWAVSRKRWRNNLRGDLDTIVMKALRKTPTERYPSAAAFAEDLRRYLRGDAVSAQPRSIGYRLRKLTHRHKSALLGAAAAVTALALIAAIVIWPLKKVVSTLAGQTLGARSIAVLPFDNIGVDTANDYFTQGIQDEVLTRLANISGLKVISRHATARFTNPADRVQSARRSLEVGNVLEGSVQVQGNRVLVNVRLTETAGNTNLWAESFDRPTDDIFNVERDIAESVAAHLQAKLMPAERTAVAVVDTRNADAHIADLWGRFYMAKRDAKSVQKAIEYFNDAIRLDRDYALAYADSSTALFYRANLLDGPESAPVKEQARVAAQHAIALEPGLAEAHSALGWVLLYFDWNLSAAEREMELAVQLAPNSSRAKAGLANLLAVFGEPDRAIKMMNEARSLDPLSSVLSTDLANYSLGQMRYEEAAAWSRKALELDQNAPYCHGTLAIVFLARGDLHEAEQQAAAEPDEEWQDFTQTLVKQGGADRAAAGKSLREFIGRHEKSSPFLVASLYAFRGDADSAFLWLDRAYRARDLGTIDFRESPFFLRYRADARYRRFCETLGVASLST